MGFGAFQRNTSWFYCDRFEELQRRLTVKVEVNDFGDVCVQLSAARSSDSNARTIYYFEKGTTLDDANKLPELDGFRQKDLRRESTIIKKKKKEASFRSILDPHIKDRNGNLKNPDFDETIFESTLNNNYLIFRSKCQLWKVKIEDLKDCNDLIGSFPKCFLDLKELTEQDNSFIQKVFPGSSQDGSKICISIRRDEEEGLNTLVTWDLDLNAEINQYEAVDPARVAFDYEGNCAIARFELGESLIDIDDRCSKFTAFDFDEDDL